MDANFTAIGNGHLIFIMPHGTFRFGPYFCQPVIAGLGEDNEPFICTMDCIGAK
jgi:20S proteasome alpha/beta subunit